MEKSTKIWLGVGLGTLVLGTITYFVWQGQIDKKKFAARKNKTEGSGGGGERTQIDEGTVGSNEKRPSSGFPLAIGSVGRNVLMVQQALNMSGAKVVIDGRLGEETAKAQNWLCGIGRYNMDVCKIDQGEFATLMNKAGGQQKVLSEGMKNSAFKTIYNQYQ